VVEVYFLVAKLIPADITKMNDHERREHQTQKEQSEDNFL